MGALFKAMAVANRAVPRRPASNPPGQASVSAAEILSPRRSRCRACARVFHAPGRRFEGVYASLNGGVGSRDEPARSCAQPRPHGGRARRSRPTSGDPLSGPFGRRAGDHRAVSARGAAALRRAGHRDARPRPRRHRRRLRHDPVRRRGARVVGAAHAGWKGALDGVRGDGRRDGAAGAQVAGSARRSAPASPSRPTRSARSLSPLSQRREVRRVSSREASTPGGRCSTCTAISPSAPRAPASAASKTSASTPTPTRRASSAIAAPPTARSPTTAAWWRRSRLA